MNIRQLNEAIDNAMSDNFDDIRYFEDVVERNGDFICRYNKLPDDFIDRYGNENYTVMSAFNYSKKEGGLIGSLKYYNDYVVLIPNYKTFYFSYS